MKESEEKERRLQKATLAIQEKYGKNALLKGMNFLEGGTTRERNGQIGGHKADLGDTMDKDFPYKDIIDLPHHRSTSREHMSIYDRASQFSPFAALSGYDDVIAETGRLTDDLIDLPEDIRDELNRKLMRISDIISNGYRPEIRIIYFVPDKTKVGGSYDEYSGEVKSVDTTFRRMIFYDNDKNISGKIFDIDMITAIYGGIFDELL